MQELMPGAGIADDIIPLQFSLRIYILATQAYNYHSRFEMMIEATIHGLAYHYIVAMTFSSRFHFFIFRAIDFRLHL